MARPLLRLPAHVINGVGVALGIGLLQLAVGALAGHTAAAAASSGAVCASLADLPNPPARIAHRVGTAAIFSVLVTCAVTLLRPSPLGLAVAAVVLGLCSGLALSWGPRAGPVSFSGVLAFVFTMGAPPPPGLQAAAAHIGWTALGTLLYVGWALLSSRLLQRRYCTLALAATLGAAGRLLRSRAALLARERAGAAPSLQAWIRDEAAFAERLQTTRDFLFAAPESDWQRRQTAMLLVAIDLRDTLLAGELDLDLLGDDHAGTELREAFALQLDAIADTLLALDDALRLHLPLPAVDLADVAQQRLRRAAELPASTGSARLAPVLAERARRLLDDVAQLRGLMLGAGAPPQPALGRAELQMFVTVEPWSFAALKRSFDWQSPVLRHALRSGVALGSAYALALALPWASHPHWMVLSVAVVLRGNLEQTLQRRNARVAGTVIGCLIVLAFAQLGVMWLSTLLFLVAVAIAHSFITARYLVTAAAASVMALLQAWLAQPEAGFAVPERLADTLIGALLASAFAYVLPSWERSALARVVGRVQRALGALAAQVLRWPTAPSDDGAGADLQLRLARREAYDAIASLAAIAQRTAVEPRPVRVPLYALATLLNHAQVLLAHLAAVRLTLTRHIGGLDREHAEPALEQGAQRLLGCLRGDEKPASEMAISVADAADLTVDLPLLPPSQAPLPWLRRRLHLAAIAAARVAQAARSLRATAGG